MNNTQFKNSPEVPQDNQWHIFNNKTTNSRHESADSGLNYSNTSISTYDSPLPSETSLNYSTDQRDEHQIESQIPSGNIQGQYQRTATANLYFQNGIAYPISSNTYSHPTNSSFNYSEDDVFIVDQSTNNQMNESLTIANSQYQTRIKQLLIENSSMKQEIEELRFYRDVCLDRFEEDENNRELRKKKIITTQNDDRLHQEIPANPTKSVFMKQVEPVLKEKLIAMNNRCLDFEEQLRIYKKVLYLVTESLNPEILTEINNKTNLEPIRPPPIVQMQHFAGFSLYPNIHRPMPIFPIHQKIKYSNNAEPEINLDPIKFLNNLLKIVKENQELGNQVRYLPLKIHDLISINLKLNKESSDLKKINQTLESYMKVKDSVIRDLEYKIVILNDKILMNRRENKNSCINEIVKGFQDKLEVKKIEEENTVCESDFPYKYETYDV